MKNLILALWVLASGPAMAVGYNYYVVVTTTVSTVSTPMVNMLTPNRLELFNNATTGILWINTTPVSGQINCAPAVVGFGLPISPNNFGYLWIQGVLSCIPMGISSAGVLPTSGNGG